MEQIPEKLIIKYIDRSEQSAIPIINGAFGALTPDGTLLIHFYLDRKSMPNQIEIEHIEHNIFGNEKPVSFEDDADVIREIIAKVAINPQVAKKIAKWLIQKVEESETM